MSTPRKLRLSRGSSIPLVIMAVTALVAVEAAGQAPVSEGTREAYRPFTAKYLWTYIDDQGATINFSGKFHRTADGSFSQIEEMEGPRRERGTVQYIVNIADRSWTSARSYTHTSTTVVYLDDRKFQNMVSEVAGNCAILEDGSYRRVGESELLGIKVIEMESKVGRDTVLRDSIAPELGCFVLQHLLVDHGEVRAIEQVTQITLGEPDPDALHVPAGYAEASPLEFEARWQQLFGREYYGAAQAKRLELEYQQGKARQRQRNNR